MATQPDNQLTWLVNTSKGHLTEAPFFCYHHLSNILFHAYQHPLFWFFLIFTLRYLRLIVHLISFWSYKPTPIPSNPTLTPQDCTVIIPTVDPAHVEFTESLQSCLLNRPKEIIIVTVGLEKYAIAQKLTGIYAPTCLDTKITVLVSQKANKRTQVSIAIEKVSTKISVLMDDHVLWGRNFLPTALAPFEDPAIGAVGTNKRVRKEHLGFNVLSYWNMLGALYLERHNIEIRATNAIDGGVFVISGRTSLHRTEILQHPDFLPGFTNEKFFFRLFGPLNADDDNYITRFEVLRGWGIKIQYSDEACIETTLGTYPKFVQQCLRWVRTTWRSNPASLFTDRTVWKSQPWCVYAVYFTSFFNFALFNDAGLAYLLWQDEEYGTPENLTALGIWIFATKMVKLWAFFSRHPEDLRMLPGYFAFAYFHSFIKLYAMVTFWNCHWGGRDLDAITKAAGGGGGGTMPSPPTTPEASEGGDTPLFQTPNSQPDQGDNKNPSPGTPTPKGGAKTSAPRAPVPQADQAKQADQSIKKTPSPGTPTPQAKQATESTKATPSPLKSTSQTDGSPKKPQTPKRGFQPFTPPPNLESFHLHARPVPKNKSPVAGGSSSSSSSPASKINNNTSSSPPPPPASSSQSTTTTTTSTTTTTNPTSTTTITTQTIPCKHCFEHRCLAILLILLFLSSVLIHYLFASWRLLPQGVGIMDAASGERGGGLVEYVPKDWARTMPGGFGRPVVAVRTVGGMG